MKAVIDTNVVVDFLQGHAGARAELDRYRDPSLSVVTWIEVMVGATADQESRLRAFLSSFELLGVSEAVAERAVLLRRTHRIRLPDALIWATAQIHERILVTRNTRDFPTGDPGIRVPYQRRG